ncbi:hypothetical protein PCC9214_04696 [Planktothrix tepida]|uniref:Uncharacterized protein n=1 Tax=Planktothrix tepida PCC 9214 TaxID=671072 RepID=A0A1J1LMG8_9CYAN|nr:hypothetical protein [Planktothrix tepida]CAD5980729.1 hypothetical protein PCC9214_04696 [Planktothrix tepida]CUR33683.1 hypothetical protein PL9214520222 [Planktothrix tepida PCC 9214]
MSSLTASEIRFQSIFSFFARAKSSPNYRKRLAIHYLKCKGDTLNRRDQKGFSEWIHHLFLQVPFPVEYIAGQPYQSAAEMTEDVRLTGVLKISTDFNDPVVLSREDNLLYRAIHDSHHILGGWDFSWEGELAACQYFCSLTNNRLYHRILFSELILQAAAYLYLGDFPQEQKLVLTLPY